MRELKKAMTEMLPEHWKNNEIGIVVQSWLSVSRTHGLIAQSARTYEQNLVTVVSSPTKANFLLSIVTSKTPSDKYHI